MRADFDLAVVGGGIMGCAAALRAAEGGMNVVLVERDGLGSGASGVNAGTLSLQIKRVRLIPYALKGYALWAEAGDRVGFARTGGLTVAFDPREAALLEERMSLKRAAGAPIDLISPRDARARAPALSANVLAASWCAADGYANASLTGAYYRALLREAGVEVFERTPALDIARDESGFSIEVPQQRIGARRLLLACGAWLPAAGRMIGLDLPVRARVNTVTVTERGPRIVEPVIIHATGLLTLKQKPNGTVLIGGGWQGRGDPGTGRGEVAIETLIPNLQLACHAIPPLAAFRIVRSWTGYEANVPDFYPLAGPAPGVPDAFILGCVRGGYTIGPYIGRLTGDLILSREPEMPLFDPARFQPAGGTGAEPTRSGVDAA